MKLITNIPYSEGSFNQLYEFDTTFNKMNMLKTNRTLT